MKIKDHKLRLAEMGCMVCKQPAIFHHCMGGSMKDAGFHKGMAQKNNDWLIIPLCPLHHNGDRGLHTIGVRSWEDRYGNQIDMLAEVSGLTGFDVINAARSWIEQHSKR